MNQCDVFCYSGHGHHDSNDLDGGFTPAMGMTNSWRFWTGRLLLASTHAADGDFATAYQMSTNHIQMLQDNGGAQDANVLETAILGYHEMTNVNIDVAFRIFAGFSSAGMGMGNVATNYANQAPLPYRKGILECLR